MAPARPQGLSGAPILSFGDVGLWGICFKTVSLFDVVKLAKSAIICYVE